MNIVVCVKQVPDTWAEKKLDASDTTLDRARDRPGDERDGRVRRRGGAQAQGGARRRGHRPVHGSGRRDRDDAQGAVDGRRQGDPRARRRRCTARTRWRRRSRWPRRSARLRGFDLVLLGSESTDARMSVVPAMLAERLGLPQLTFARQGQQSTARTVTIKRLTDDGYQVVEASTPAVVSVVEKINEPRYPSFKGIMAAKKKPVETLALADLGRRRRRRSGWPARGARSSRSRPRRRGRPARRHGRGRRRGQARRVPRRPRSSSDPKGSEEHSWLRFSFWSSTPTVRSRRSPPSC